ncbi:MAG: ABC-F family ATP-binding cassette domain-containing protein [Anaerolineae bacterium]|nr:ABC-F family ATP-binding cassette domain-containing protein [Anaerolineae bacterium]MDW8070124.1 ABC-F family ATP-binding cassette domain-containing protein [Anaerolineae bacterium]
MALLQTFGVSKHFGAQDVLVEVNVQIARGERIGLVGANGSGKSTLLRILAGLEEPSSGYVRRTRGLHIGYLPQEVTLQSSDVSLWEHVAAAFAELHCQAEALRRLEEALATTHDDATRAQLLAQYGKAQTSFEAAGGYMWEQRVRRVLKGLSFDERDYTRSLAQLSGGEQTRAYLARLLLEEPELLLLDEPTNHLDLSAVEWLEEHLLNWHGALVIVAHDRYLLDRITTRIWELEDGCVRSYRGNYSAYVTQRAERRLRQQRLYEQQQEYIARQEDFIRRTFANQRARSAQDRRKRLERLERVEPVRRERHIRLRLTTDLRSGDLVLATHDLVVGYQADEPLFACPDLAIYRGERIALLGPNGAGKTTFLRTILQEVPPLRGQVRIGASVKIGYLAQAHIGLDMQRSVLDEILATKDMTLQEARTFLGRFLFSGDDVYKPIGVLSGGERARVALARLVLQGANFLVLDEPTGHLDIPSQELLQSVLADFEGTILLVSHDRFFVDALATCIWALEDGQLRVVPGNYTAYLAVRRQERDAQTSEETGVHRRTSREELREKRRAESIQSEQGAPRLSPYRRQRALEEVQEAIRQTEERLAHLARALEEASRTQSVERITTLGREYQAVEEELTRLFDRWAELEAL